VGSNHDIIKVADRSFEDVSHLKCFGTTVTNEFDLG
jgi:hypothetical protein